MTKHKMVTLRLHRSGVLLVILLAILFAILIFVAGCVTGMQFARIVQIHPARYTSTHASDSLASCSGCPSARWLQ